MVLDITNTDMVFVLVSASSGCCILCCAMVFCWKDAARRQYWAHQGSVAVAQEPRASAAADGSSLDAANPANRSLLTGYVVPVRRLDICTQGRKAAQAAANVAGAAAAAAKRRAPRGANNAQRSYAKVTAVPVDASERRADELARLYGELTGFRDDESETSTPRRLPPSKRRSKKGDIVSDMHRAARRLEEGRLIKAPSRSDEAEREDASNRSSSSAAAVRADTPGRSVGSVATASTRASSAGNSKRNKDAAPDALRKSANADAGAAISIKRQAEFGVHWKVGGERDQLRPLYAAVPATAYGRQLQPEPGDDSGLVVDSAEPAEPTVVGSALGPQAAPSISHERGVQRVSDEKLEVDATAASQIAETQQCQHCEDGESSVRSDTTRSLPRESAGDAGLQTTVSLGDGGDLLQQIELPVSARSPGTQRRAWDQKFETLDAQLAIEVEDDRALSLAMDVFPLTHAGLPSAPRGTPGAVARRMDAAKPPKGAPGGGRGRSSSGGRRPQQAADGNSRTSKGSRTPSKSSTKRAKSSSHSES